LGIPLIAALLRAGFEHGFHKLSAMALTAVVLTVLGLFLHWKFTSDPPRLFSRKEEKKREMRRLDFGITLFLMVNFLSGGVLFVWCGLQPFTQSPVSNWLLRIASFAIGGISLILGLVFAFRVFMLLTGKRSWKLGKFKIG
jgi:hypothetical protein